MTPLKSLKERRSFRAIQRRGLRRATPAFVFACRPNGAGAPRLGLTVSRKVGKAVERNRVRRRLRMAAWEVAVDFPATPRVAALDCVLIARRTALRYPFDRLKTDMRRVWLSAQETFSRQPL